MRKVVTALELPEFSKTVPNDAAGTPDESSLVSNGGVTQNRQPDVTTVTRASHFGKAAGRDFFGDRISGRLDGRERQGCEAI